MGTLNDRVALVTGGGRGIGRAIALPIGRRLEPEEIAPLAVYLTSEDTRMVTGQAWNICGRMLIV